MSGRSKYHPLQGRGGSVSLPKNGALLEAWCWSVCCWQVGQPANHRQGGFRRWTVHAVGPMHSITTCHGHFEHEAFVRTDCWEKKLTSREQMISSTCLLNYSQVTIGTQIFTFCGHSKRSIHTPLPRNLPRVIIKLCSFQIPVQPAKLLTTAHISKSIHISGHL